MGAMHGYSIARRIEQVADNLLRMSQGSIYPALIRLEQQGLDQDAVGGLGDQPQGQDLLADGGRQASAAGSKWPTGSRRRRSCRDSSRPSHDARRSFGACSPSSARAVSTRELEDEIQAHLELAERDAMAAGLCREEARRGGAARLRQRRTHQGRTPRSPQRAMDREPGQGLPLRVAPAAPRSRLRVRRHRCHGHWHRRQHGDVQPGRRASC